MMMAMTKSVNHVGLYIGLAVLAHYVIIMSAFSLINTHWLLSDTGVGSVECSDTSPFEHVRFEDRGKTWDVQHRLIDLKLTIYDPKTHEMACSYASK